MGDLGMFCRISNVFACLSVRQGRGGDPTERWQDKSRKLRPGRMGEERKQISYLAQFEVLHLTFSNRTTHWNIETMCKLRGSRS
jgi:hypothetical protein